MSDAQRNLRRMHKAHQPGGGTRRGNVVSKGHGKPSDPSDPHAEHGLESEEGQAMREQQEAEDAQRQQYEDMMNQSAYGGYGGMPGMMPDGYNIDPSVFYGAEAPDAIENPSPLDAAMEMHDSLEQHTDEMSGWMGRPVYGHRREHVHAVPVPTTISAKESDREAFVRSWQRGRLGFMDSLANVSAQQVLSWESPEHIARQWTLTMLAHRYQNGTISASFPPDNQTTNTDLKLHLEWGVAGATERVDLDYPWAGMQLTLNAASIRVVAPTRSLFGNIVPMIGGFLTPGHNASRMDNQRAPTFTVYGINLPISSAPVVQVIPARARAYRVILQGDQGAVDSQAVVVEQGVIVAGAFVGLALDNSNAFSLPVNMTVRPNAIPIEGAMQALRFKNGSATTAMTINVEFLLDVG